MAAARSKTSRVYCAGPLFNPAERAEMTAIADRLIESGHSVYLPHRDGMEFRRILDVLEDRGWSMPTAGQFLHSAIFALDVFQLAEHCDSMVWNLNGRVPDEGAVSEAAMAWTLGIPMVAFSDDARSLIEGRINPLLVGMVRFQLVRSIPEIPAALEAEVARSNSDRPRHLSPAMQQTVDQGRRLWECMLEMGAQFNNVRIADVVIELFAPRQPSSAP